MPTSRCAAKLRQRRREFADSIKGEGAKAIPAPVIPPREQTNNADFSGILIRKLIGITLLDSDSYIEIQTLMTPLNFLKNCKVAARALGETVNL